MPCLSAFEPGRMLAELASYRALYPAGVGAGQSETQIHWFTKPHRRWQTANNEGHAAGSPRGQNAGSAQTIFPRLQLPFLGIQGKVNTAIVPTPAIVTVLDGISLFWDISI